MTDTRSAVDIVLCRGCCCGSPAKHPGTDHEAQSAQLTALADRLPTVRLRISDCLGPCERANVVVVRAAAAPAGGRRSAPLWFGGISDDAETAALVAWVEDLATRPATEPNTPPPGLDALRIAAHGPQRRAERAQERAASSAADCETAGCCG